MDSKIQQIRKKLYLARDGARVSSLRKNGIDYKMIFGVPIVTLRKIAEAYAPDAELANALWPEDNRELKILATLIQDPEVFTEAEAWVNGVRNLELAEQATSNLFCKLPDAGNLAEKWVQSSELYISVSGFLLYTRLFMNNFQPNMETYFHAVYHAINGESSLLKNAALASLKRLGRQSAIYSKDILARFESSIFYDELKFEFEFYA